jgi:large subunit ribosomal protein L2
MYLLPMQISRFKPYTNGIRHRTNIKKNFLSKVNNLVKQSIVGFKKFKGRSSETGRITTRHLGGGCKRKFRVLEISDIKRQGVVISIMYDPYRSSFISLNFDVTSNTFFRTIATAGVGPGSLQECNREKVDLKLGNRTDLENVPPGSILHSLSINSKIKCVRSAGLYFQIIQKDLNLCRVRLPSGLIKKAPSRSFGTIGVISNFQHSSIYLGKAGRSRLLGIRPSVRGVAMNPVDHPHGGRTNGGRPSVTPWGIPTKGKPTVIKKR